MAGVLLQFMRSMAVRVYWLCDYTQLALSSWLALGLRRSSHYVVFGLLPLPVL